MDLFTSEFRELLGLAALGSEGVRSRAVRTPEQAKRF
jgi:hypothetical protein